MDFVHAILYCIVKTVEYGLNITSAHFLANMDDSRFTKSRKRWNSSAEAADSEVSIPSHAFSVFVFALKSSEVMVRDPVGGSVQKLPTLQEGEQVQVRGLEREQRTLLTSPAGELPQENRRVQNGYHSTSDCHASTSPPCHRMHVLHLGGGSLIIAEGFDSLIYALSRILSTLCRTSRL